MSIILEGCDLSGKTTLAEGLHWPLMTREIGGRGQATLDSCMRLYVGFDIWVRWWPTEYVYDRVLRKQYVCTVLDQWKFKLLSDVNGAVLIWLDPSSAVLKTRYKKRHEEHAFEIVTAIKEEYTKLFTEDSKMLPPIFFEKSLSQALALHKSLQTRSVRWMGFDVDGWGTLEKDKIVICGEKISKDSRAKHPFEFRTNKGCGQYLFQALAKTGIKPGDIHIMNLWHKNGSQGDWEGALTLLQPKKIIAFGKKVQAELIRANFENVEIPHPQFWKRFHYKDIIGYIKILQEAFDDSL